MKAINTTALGARSARWGIPVVGMLWSLAASAAPVLSMSYNIPTDVAPLCVTASITLSNSTPTVPYDPLAGVQFDISYPSGQFALSSVTAGAGASLAKLDSNGTLPTTGYARVVLSPNGTSTLIEGAIATVNFCHTATGGWADSQFALRDVVFGNALATAVNVMPGVVSATPVIAWGGDNDGDGIPDNYDSDDDNDGMPDWWEIQNGFNPKVADSSGDYDGDGVSNLDEYRYGLNPRLADSNGDGIPDAQEVANINAAMSVIVNLLLSN